MATIAQPLPGTRIEQPKPGLQIGKYFRWSVDHKIIGVQYLGLAFTFFKPGVLADGKLSGQTFRKGSTGAPILDVAPGAVECRVTSIVEQGDHHVVVGEVVEAHLHTPPTGRADAAILEMKDLGDNVFYGG